MIMKKILCLFICTICTLVFFDSCQSADPELMDCEVSYEKDLLPVIQTYCGNGYCHPHSNQDFSSYFADYENIKEVVDNGKLKAQIVDLKTMPKNLTVEGTDDSFAEFRELFACWIKEGGLDN